MKNKTMNNLIAACEVMSSNGVTVNITTTSAELKEFGQFLIDKAESDLRERIRQGKEDVLLSVDETLIRLKIGNRSTLWRWEKKGYLKPVRSGTKCLYRESDINRILTSKNHQR